jgi:hypothetical protein
MQKLGGAAILMQQNLNDVTYLYPNNPDFDVIKNSKPFEIFSDVALNFLDDLSKSLFANSAAQKLPDVISFAFWCRKANMQRLKESYSDGRIRVGRGIAFHITPSNVPINFAYSLVTGLVAGNINIVRVPSKDFEQTQLVCNEIAQLLCSNKYPQLAEKIVLMKYDRQSTATEYFSAICDVRIIWGGDASINQIRQCSIPPRSFDITFADRYSLCVINADEYINEKNPKNIANAFYNDTFLYDQNACSAPHLMIWLGSDENIRKSKDEFWQALHSLVQEKYNLQPVVAVDKLTAMYRQAIDYGEIKVTETIDNYILRIELASLQPNIEECKSYGGYFCEYTAQSLGEIAKIANRKYQTLAYYGIPREELVNFRLASNFIGIDRIVPIGQTAAFSLTWDGYNLPQVLSTICDIG